MDNEIENLDSTNETEDTDTVNDEEVADTESEEAENKPEYSENEKKLYARAKKAEGEAKLAKEALKKANLSEKPAPVSDIDKLLDAKLEKRELESLDVSESLRKEIATYAKVQGISVKKALASDYISYLQEKEEKKTKSEKASLGTGRKATIKNDNIDISTADPRVPEGQSAFAKKHDELREALG